MTLFFMNETIARKEYTGIAYVGVRGGKTYAADVNIKAGIHPLNGFEIQNLPENRRDKEWKKIYTTTPMQLQDILIIDGEQFEVSVTYDRTREDFLKHYKCLVEKIDA